MTSAHAHLAAAPLFARVAPATLDALAAATTWVALAGGATLFEDGDAADALYIVVRGALHVLVREGDGERRVEVLGAGALAGELGVLLDEPRSAALRAVRDSELLRVPADAFLAALERDPALGVAVSRLLGQRLTKTTHQPRSRTRVRTVALVPLDDRPIEDSLVRALLEGFARTGANACHLSRTVIDRDLGPGGAATQRGEAGESRLLEVCDARERAHDIVLYVADADAGEWSQRAVRQADLVLIVARPDSQPVRGEAEQRLLGLRPPTSIELVLCHEDGRLMAPTIDWLRARTVVRHHHLRISDQSTADRVARFVTGTATGLVLSGGGARGFAHVGVLRALEQARVPVDVIGGSSMGAIVAAQYAAGFDPASMIEMNRRAFSGSDVFDLTVPTVALRKAGSTVRRLRAMFGDRQIEDLPRSFFCITSDLTHATVRVHDRGPVWLWTRASCSIPGLAPPVAFERSLLVDGGLLNNLPVDVMRRRCSGPVIAVNVTPTVDLKTDTPLTAEMSGWAHLWPLLPGGPTPRFPNIGQILSRTVFVSSVRDGQAAAAASDLHLDPPLEGIGMSDFAAIDRIVEAGYQHALARLRDWRPAPAAS